MRLIFASRTAPNNLSPRLMASFANASSSTGPLSRSWLVYRSRSDYPDQPHHRPESRLPRVVSNASEQPEFSNLPNFLSEPHGRSGGALRPSPGGWGWGDRLRSALDDSAGWRPVGARHWPRSGRPAQELLQRLAMAGGSIDRPAAASRTTACRRAVQGRLLGIYWVRDALTLSGRKLVKSPAIRNPLFWND